MLVEGKDGDAVIMRVIDLEPLVEWRLIDVLILKLNGMKKRPDEETFLNPMPQGG